MSRYRLILGFIFLILMFNQIATLGQYNSKCKVDNDCNPPELVCASNKKCKNKSLFPMTGMEIGGLIVMVSLSMFATIAGIGGGPIFVPLLLLFFGMSQKETTSLSNGLTLFSSFSKMLVSMRLNDPDIPRRSLINYDLMLSLSPLLLLGAGLGAMFSLFLANIVSIVLFIVLISWSFIESLRKTIDLCKKERAAAEAKRNAILKEGVEEKEKAQEDVKKAAELAALAPAEINQVPSEGERRKSKTFAPLADKADNLNQEEMKDLKSGDTSIKKKELDAPEPTGFDMKVGIPSEVAPKGVVSGRTAEEEKEIENIKWQESKNFTWWNTSIVLGSFVLANLISLMRGGNGVTSIIGVTQCSGGDWGLFAFFIVSMAAFSAVGSLYVLRKQKRKQVLGLTEAKDVIWSWGKLAYGYSFVVIIGAASSIAGLGGGSVMTPFMFGIQMMPKAASATALQLIFLSRVVVTLLNYISGVLLVDYFFFIGGFIAVGAIVSDCLGGYVQSKIKRQSFISSIFVTLVVICLILFCFSSAQNIKQAQNSGNSITAFGSYC